MFVWERRDCRGRIVFDKGFVEEDEICEAAADFGFWILEGSKVGLSCKPISSRRSSSSSYVCGNEIGYIDIFGALILL